MNARKALQDAGRLPHDDSATFDAGLQDILERQQAQASRPAHEELGHPQLIISLTPSGDRLQAELPGVNGMRRHLEFRNDAESFYDACLRILQAQQRREIQIGLDGAPTQHQLQHWQKHKIWADPACPFCIKEGRCGAKRPRNLGPAPIKLQGGVEVRRLPSKTQRGLKANRRLMKSLEELGL